MSHQNYFSVNLVDDLALLANTPAQDESLLHSLKHAASCMDLYVNSDKQCSYALNKNEPSLRQVTNLRNSYTHSHTSE